MFAAGCKNRAQIVRLLIAAGADINYATDNGHTTLCYAASVGFEATARVLIDAGADVNKAENRGLTPLDVASIGKHDAVARMLRDAGATRSSLHEY